MIRQGLSLLFFCLVGTTGLSAEEYLVQKGESVPLIAQKTKLSADLLQKANPDLDLTRLKTGDRLVLPQRYVVKAGDTLYSLSRSWGVEQSAVQAWNALTGPLRTGQVLVVPLLAKAKPSAAYWPVDAVPHAEGDKLKSVTFTTSGEPFRSVADGTVVYKGEFRGLGRVLLVQSPDKTVFAYGNFESAQVDFGQTVTRGQALGTTSPRAAQKFSFFAFRQNEPLDPFSVKR